MEGDEVEDVNNVDVGFSEKRSGIPEDFVIAFDMGYYFVVYGAGALKCIGMNGIYNFSDEPIPRAVIAKENSVTGFYSLLINRMNVALVKRRFVHGNKPSWNTYAMITSSEDLEKWREENDLLDE